MKNSPLNVVWHCHFFIPDVCAPSARARNLIEGQRPGEISWQVVTTFPHHPKNQLKPQDKGVLFRRESLEVTGQLVLVHRCWTWLPSVKPMIRQLIGHLSFTASSLFVGLFKLKQKPDVVVTSSPTLFSAISGWCFARRWGARWILEVRDLWPSIFADLGILSNPLALKFLTRLELFLYRQADHIVVVTEGFKKDIQQRTGLADSKFSLIRNTADLQRFVPSVKKRSYDPAQGLRVGYVGTIGRSQAVHEVIESWAKSGIPGEFLVVGEGQDKPLIQKVASQFPNHRIIIQDPVPQAMVLDVYHSLDVAVVCLKAIPLFDIFIPSKIFELMSAEVPIMAVLSGEAASLVAQSRGGWTAKPGDIDQQIKVWQQIASSFGSGKHLPTGARQWMQQYMGLKVFATAYREVLFQPK